MNSILQGLKLGKQSEGVEILRVRQQGRGLLGVSKGRLMMRWSWQARGKEEGLRGGSYNAVKEKHARIG